MAGFATHAALRAAFDDGKFFRIPFLKADPVQSSLWANYWYSAGSPGTPADPAAAPGTAFVNVLGSINVPDRAGTNKFVAGMSLIGSGPPTQRSIVTAKLHDRLVGVGGIDFTTPGVVVLNSTALPRYAGAASIGVMPWLEGGPSGVSGSFTVNLDSYTNQDGTAGRTGPSITFTTGLLLRRMFPLPLMVGDLGVRSVESLNITAAGSAGTANLVLLKPIVDAAFVTLSSSRGLASTQDFFLDRACYPRIYDGASLGFMGSMALNNTLDAATLRGELLVVYA